MSEDNTNKKTITFNVSKKESHNPNNGYKKWSRKLRSFAKVQTNKEEITVDSISDTDILIFAGSREPFTVNEFREMKTWLTNGGRMLVMMGEGGEKTSGSNINYFLEEFGMSINNDSVTRAAFYKYYHPKEVFIGNSIMVPDIIRKKNATPQNGNTSNPSNTKSSTSKSSKSSEKNHKNSDNNNNTNNNNTNNKENNNLKGDIKFPIVYPYGASLNVQRPSIALLTSGQISYPMNRPIAALWEAETVNTAGRPRGRLMVIGSTEFCSDDWIDKEENHKLMELFIQYLLNDLEIDMHSGRNEADHIVDYKPVPSVETLANLLKPCLQGLDELPHDFTKLFDLSMFKLDMDIVPVAIQLYKTLGVPHEPLTLIPPQFECPLPKLQIATFPPAMREPAPPALEQFDLDEHFAKESLRLAQLTNKCSQGEEDLEYFIGESGEILGVSQALPFGERSAKHILYAIFHSIVNFKKQDFGKDGNPDNFRLTGNNFVMGTGYIGSGGFYPTDSPTQQNTSNSPNGNGNGNNPYPAYSSLDDHVHPSPYGGPGEEKSSSALSQARNPYAVTHLAHVDLAPMNIDRNRNNLLELDPRLTFGGPAIGSNKSSGGGGGGYKK